MAVALHKANARRTAVLRVDQEKMLMEALLIRRYLCRLQGQYR